MALTAPAKPSSPSSRGIKNMYPKWKPKEVYEKHATVWYGAAPEIFLRSSLRITQKRPYGKKNVGSTPLGVEDIDQNNDVLGVYQPFTSAHSLWVLKISTKAITWYVLGVYHSFTSSARARHYGREGVTLRPCRL